MVSRIGFPSSSITAERRHSKRTSVFWSVASSGRRRTSASHRLEEGTTLAFEPESTSSTFLDFRNTFGSGSVVLKHAAANGSFLDGADRQVRPTVGAGLPSTSVTFQLAGWRYGFNGQLGSSFKPSITQEAFNAAPAGLAWVSSVVVKYLALISSRVIPT